jgi:hypothetical protein
VGGSPRPGADGRWDEQATPFHTLLALWRGRRGLILSVVAIGTALATAAGLQASLSPSPIRGAGSSAGCRAIG